MLLRRPYSGKPRNRRYLDARPWPEPDTRLRLARCLTRLVLNGLSAACMLAIEQAFWEFMSKIISARIRFLSPEQGGRLRPARDGIRPQLKLGDVFTSTVVHATMGIDVFAAGTTYNVELEIMFWDQYGSLFNHKEPAKLYEGSRLIAVGEFLE